MPTFQHGNAAKRPTLSCSAGVLLLPATVYDHTPSIAAGRFRVGLGRKNVPECLKVLEQFLEKDRQRVGPHKQAVQIC